MGSTMVFLGSCPGKETGEILDKRITKAQRKLRRWSRAIANRWVEEYYSTNKKGLLCDNIITVEIRGVSIFIDAKERASAKVLFTPSPTSKSCPVDELARRPKFDIAILPKLREKMLVAIEDKKKEAERHLAKIEKALEPLAPDIAEQVLEDEAMKIKGESADVKTGITGTDAASLRNLTPGASIGGTMGIAVGKAFEKGILDAVESAAKR